MPIHTWGRRGYASFDSSDIDHNTGQLFAQIMYNPSPTVCTEMSFDSDGQIFGWSSLATFQSPFGENKPFSKVSVGGEIYYGAKEKTGGREFWLHDETKAILMALSFCLQYRLDSDCDSSILSSSLPMPVPFIPRSRRYSTR